MTEDLRHDLRRTDSSAEYSSAIVPQYKLFFEKKLEDTLNKAAFFWNSVQNSLRLNYSLAEM